MATPADDAELLDLDEETARGPRPRVLSACDGPAGPSLDEEVASALAAREMLTGMHVPADSNEPAPLPSLDLAPPRQPRPAAPTSTPAAPTSAPAAPTSALAAPTSAPAAPEAPASQAIAIPAASARAALPAPAPTADAKEPAAAMPAVAPTSPRPATPAGLAKPPAPLSTGKVLGAPPRGPGPAGETRPSQLLNEDEVAALLGAPLGEPVRNLEHQAPSPVAAPVDALTDAPSARAGESGAMTSNGELIPEPAHEDEYDVLDAADDDGPFVGEVDEIELDDESGLEDQRDEKPVVAGEPHSKGPLGLADEMWHGRPAHESHWQVLGTPNGDARATQDARATLPSLDEQASAQATQVLSAVLDDAARRGASHVHLQSRQAGLTLRMRLAGRLVEKPNFRRMSASPAKALVARLLDFAGLAGADLARPRSGEFTHIVDGRAVRMTLSSFPTTDGPRLVISLPARPQGQLNLAALGARPAEIERIHDLLATRRGGLLLVCGPARGDRDDILAALAGQLAGMGRDVLAIGAAPWGAAQGIGAPGSAAEAGNADNPPNASNSTVDPIAGYRFRDAARHLAGQDADAIILAELRDPPTAAAALEAVLAGAMVVAGLAAATAAEALGILAEMDVESWPLATMLRGAIICRTLPRLCPPRGTSGQDGHVRLISLLEPSRELVRLVRAAAGAEAIAAAVPNAGPAALLDLAAGAVRDGILSAEDAAGIP
jgi:type II secretory ATPase GspE/PulE/Tfp pilus assembly ATPase PilB-like protein